MQGLNCAWELNALPRLLRTIPPPPSAIWARSCRNVAHQTSYNNCAFVATVATATVGTADWWKKEMKRDECVCSSPPPSPKQCTCVPPRLIRHAAVRLSAFQPIALHDGSSRWEAAAAASHLSSRFQKNHKLEDFCFTYLASLPNTTVRKLSHQGTSATTQSCIFAQWQYCNCLICWYDGWISSLSSLWGTGRLGQQQH